MSKLENLKSWWLIVCLGLVTSGCSSLMDQIGASHQQRMDAPATLKPSPSVTLAPAIAQPAPSGANFPGGDFDVRSAQAHVDLAHQLATSEEERNALVKHVQRLQSLLEERDRTLAQASQEIQAANAEMVRVRKELQQWHQETAALRDRLHSAEKENVASMKSIISLLEQAVEQNAEPEEKKEKTQDGTEEP